MAHCPKCGRGRIPKPKVGPRRCKRCGDLRQLIFPALPAFALSDAEWEAQKTT